MDMNQHEQAFVETFIQPARRERAMFCLSNPKKRREFIDRFAHHGRDVLVPKYLRSIKPNQQHPKSICAILRGLGAPTNCYVISEPLDGVEMDLLAALEKVVGYGNGAVMSCIPGRLGYFEGEWRERYVLENRDEPPR